MLPPSVKNQTTVPKQKVKHCERTEKQNTDKTRKPTRCFLFFAHRTLKKRILFPTHIWHIAYCPTHKPFLRKSQRAKFCRHTSGY